MTIPWTPDDAEARQLLDNRIETFDVDPAAMTLWERFVSWLNDALAINIDPSGAGGVILQVVLVLAVGVMAFLVFRYFRPAVSPAGQDTADQLADPSVSAAQYLHEAQRLLAAEQFDQAFLQAYRYMVRTASQRGLIEVTPSTTATTFGVSLTTVLPQHRQAIFDASAEFNRISYGGSIPTREATDAMFELAKTVAASAPQQPGHHNDALRLMPR